jgi:hypothetical protein
MFWLFGMVSGVLPGAAASRNGRNAPGNRNFRGVTIVLLLDVSRPLDLESGRQAQGETL